MLADRVRMGSTQSEYWDIVDVLPSEYEFSSGRNAMFPSFIAPKTCTLYITLRNINLLKRNLDEVSIYLCRNRDYIITSSTQKFVFNPNDWGSPYEIEGNYTELDLPVCRAINENGNITISHEGFDVEKGDYIHLHLFHWFTIREPEYIELCVKVDSMDNPDIFNMKIFGSSTCYLTTAMVGYYGKDDKGIELTSMRKLREFYKDKHKETLEEYKVISRYIVQGIEQSGHKDYWYSEIKKVVDKIVIWVANEEWEKAEVAYLDLYYKLREKFYSEGD